MMTLSTRQAQSTQPDKTHNISGCNFQYQFRSPIR